MAAGGERFPGGSGSGAARRLSRPLLPLVLALALVACKKGVVVKGRVVNAMTGEPVAGAKVKVRFQRLDANYNWVDAGHADLTSGPDGGFSTECPELKSRFFVYALRDGFYPNYDFRPARRLERRPLQMINSVEIRLHPVVSPRRLPSGEGEIRFYPPAKRMGWNFAAARMVVEGAADFVGRPDLGSDKIVILEARGRGGFRRAVGLSGPWALFNMPQAPSEGYEKQVDLRQVPRGERTCYYLRTADGFHYAKIDVTGTVEGRDFVGLRFYWVYQPDGSRTLEIPLEQSPQGAGAGR